MNESFIRRHGDRVLRVCYQQLGDMELAEKAFIDTFCAINQIRKSGFLISSREIIEVAMMTCEEYLPKSATTI